MTLAAASNPERIKARRWPGVLLSLFVPGFGLVRAARPLRGLAWFGGLQLMSVVIALLFITRSVPNWLIGVGMIAGFGCYVAMLVDSFRPGRMTWPLALGFVVLFSALVALPPMAQLLAQSFKIPTGAMEPTLLGASQGQPDYIIVDRISYLVAPPKRGDLVVFRTTGILGISSDTFYVKRLVGLPGELIEIRGGHLFADGRQLAEDSGIPAINYTAPRLRMPSAPLGEGEKYTIPKDAYFFLGDNSAHSFDSRYWGSVPRENIYGKVARIYYPFSRIGVPR